MPPGGPGPDLLQVREVVLYAKQSLNLACVPLVSGFLFWAMVSSELRDAQIFSH